jgi:serine/threonine-protein kinase
MAFVDGESLGQRIRSRGPMPPSELARILREVAWGLAYAHAQGVVHRDVKADNILLERGSGRALVADFGIARVAQATGMTGVGEIVGTAEYMSPEQASGEPVDGRSDLYSLGVVAYYALAGTLPFAGPTVAAVLSKLLTQAAVPVSDVCEGVPSRLAQAVDRCLAKDPADRFPKGEDLADAVAAAIEARRELPVPIRVFSKKSQELRRTIGGVLFFDLYFGALAIALAAQGAAYPALAMGAIAVLFAAIPVSGLLGQVRALLKTGYGLGELVLAWRAEVEREREERTFEFGRSATLFERAMRLVAVAGVGSTLLGVAWQLAKWTGGGAFAGQHLIILGVTAALGGGAISLLRYEARTNLGGRLLGRLWESGLGKALFRLAGVGLRPSAIAAPATHRPTELALGMAVDALFDALPRPAKRQLGDLPKVVRGLEDDARRMRRRVEELEDSVAKIEAGRRSESSALPHDAHAGRREAIDRDLHAARDAAKQRLADAVTALEGIRLNLLRLTAGTGSVDSLTADLAAAREVSDNVGFLLAGQAEVEQALKP